MNVNLRPVKNSSNISIVLKVCTEAEREAKLWDWPLGTEQLDLTINQIDLNMGAPLNPNQMFIGGRAYTIILLINYIVILIKLYVTDLISYT